MTCRRCGCEDPKCRCKECRAGGRAKSKTQSKIVTSIADKPAILPEVVPDNSLQEVVDKAAAESRVEEKVRLKEYYDTSASYAWAKASEVQNFGEDIEGSARHLRNSHRSWETLEDLASSDLDLNSKVLHKEFGHDWDKELDTTSDGLRVYAAKKVMDRFPDTWRKKSGGSDEEQRALRLQYIKSYIELNDKVKENLLKDQDYKQDLTELSAHLKEKIREFRANDRFDPRANDLVNVYNAALVHGPVDHNIQDYLREFSGKTDRREFFLLPVDELSEIKSRASKDKQKLSKLIKGKSLNSVFGKVKEIKGQLREDKFYTNESFTIKGNSQYSDYDKAKDFLSANIRGGQFGNSLSDSEKKEHTVAAARSLEDLSKVTGLSVKKLLSDGDLALAFGARGSGKAMAHYEPKNRVINLTRKKGFGSFAHEIAHAIDNHIAPKKGASDKTYGSENFGALENSEVKNAYAELETKFSEMRKRIRSSQSYVALSPAQKAYWVSRPEVFARSFERFVYDKMERSGHENTYLAVKVNSEMWPTEEEAKALDPLFEKLFAAIKG